MELAKKGGTEEGKAMKRMCAWCDRGLDRSERPEDVPVTNGVCKVCRRKFFASARTTEADSRSGLEGVGDGSGRAGGHVPTE
jgi:hypothetical protein